MTSSNFQFVYLELPYFFDEVTVKNQDVIINESKKDYIYIYHFLVLPILGLRRI